MESNLQEGHLDSEEYSKKPSKVSWASVWAGVLVGIVTLILLNMLGVGIGFSTLDIQEERNPAKGLGIGSGIWYVISSLIALFAAGWVAGRMAQTRRLFDGMIHGVLAWCVVTLLSLYFITSTIGSIIGGAGSLVGSSISSLSKGTGSIAEMVAPEVSKQLGGFDFSEMENSGTTKQTIDMFRKADGDPAKVNRNELADVIMTQSSKTRPEALKTADSLMGKFREASAKLEATKDEAIVKAKETGDDVADAASKTFIFSFFIFLIGGAAAAFGAKSGTESKSNNFYHKNVRTTRTVL